MKLLFKLVSAVSGRVAARLGRTVFRSVWSKIDAADPPEATTAEASMPKVVGAAALEAATMAGVAAAVNRFTAAGFHHLFGVWPGEKGSPGEQQPSGEKRSQDKKPDKR
jgi:hypothetical protein